MAIVAHTHPFVIGADTHARNHAISILASPNGEVIDDAQFPTTAAGLKRAVAWAGRRTGGDLGAVWVIEGTGTYGARLPRAAAEAGYTVVEAARMNARANRGLGKSDPLDARRIAQAVLPLGVSQLRHATSGRWRAIRCPSPGHLSRPHEHRTDRNDQRAPRTAARDIPRH
jgi:transposase